MDLLLAVPWIAWSVLLPLVAAALAFAAGRLAVAIGLVTAILVTAGIAVLALQVASGGPQVQHVGGWLAPLGITLRADGLATLMLALTAVVGFAVTVYAAGYFASATARGRHFWPLWLFLWAALNALFLSADVFNVYVTLELLGLSAVALAALTGTPAALAAAMRYLLVSLLGSLAYLLGVALLYASFATLDMVELGQRTAPALPVWLALAAMTAGLLLKTALFPLHFWLPPAHANAPAPVSALLSALVVKASFYLLLRLWFQVFPEALTPALLQVVGALGAAAVLWGSLLALRQARLKLLVAYSTVAQLGYLFLAFPMIAATGGLAWSGTVYFALSHGVAKAAMFLAAGTMMHVAGHDRIAELRDVAPRLRMGMLSFALAGISLVGLPPSGGFIAKWLLLKAALSSGQWWWAVILLLGGLLAAGYVFRITAYAFVTGATRQAVPGVARMEWSAISLALIATLLGLLAFLPLEFLDAAGPDVEVLALRGAR